MTEKLDPSKMKEFGELMQGFKNIPSSSQRGRSNNPIAFIMALGQFFKFARAANRLKTPAMEKQWKDDMYNKRWKNFLTVPIFIAVCIFFLWLGFTLKQGFFNIIYWYIWMGLAGIFLILGIYTWFSYLLIIIKGKKHD
ncbi:MAG: hypothetical protein WCT53_03480 [Candidatus Gracilibacteria bacterium]|jgi:hypothetical protein